QTLANNPNLTIGEVNLWRNNPHEEMPYLFGRYGKTQQVSLELEQVIETAGKRKKRIALQQVHTQNAVLNFEELLRNLKFSLRSTIIELEKIQLEEQLLKNSLDIFEDLLISYKKQSELKNLSRADYLRIQTEYIQFKEDYTSLLSNKNNLVYDLKVYLGDTTEDSFEIYQPLMVSDKLSRKLPMDLVEEALANRSDFKLIKQQKEIAHKELDIEKAARIPDVTVGLGYDRGGNIMQDFVGLSISFDLPLLNKNQGNIRKAQVEIEKSFNEERKMNNEIVNEVNRLKKQLIIYESVLKEYTDEDQLSVTEMMNNYVKNFKQSRISLIEFLDFSDSYLKSQQAFLNQKEQYLKTFEELQFIVGKDL
ncbi:TolC family protein, partial [Myroides ceti]